MILCVDAYNVLKQNLGSVMIGEAERRQFINRLVSYAHRKGHRIIVVFDGGPYSQPARFKERDLTVIYSGQKESADDVIKKFLSQHTGQQPVLVSSDRALCDYVRHFGVASIDSDAFYHMLHNAEEVTPIRVVKSTAQATKRPGHDSGPELDALMQQASNIIAYKDEAEVPVRERSSKTLSKKEKKLLKVVKKL